MVGNTASGERRERTSNLEPYTLCLVILWINFPPECQLTGAVKACPWLCPWYLEEGSTQGVTQALFPLTPAHTVVPAVAPFILPAQLQGQSSQPSPDLYPHPSYLPQVDFLNSLASVIIVSSFAGCPSPLPQEST